MRTPLLDVLDWLIPKAIAFCVLFALLLLLFAEASALAAEPGAAPGVPVETAIPISTGAGGIGLGGALVYWAMNGRLRAFEETIRELRKTASDTQTRMHEDLGRLSDLFSRIDQLMARLDQIEHTYRAAELNTRNKIHDQRSTIQLHEARLIRLEERFNGLVDRMAAAAGAEGIPRRIEDPPTGPLTDSGRHRTVR